MLRLQNRSLQERTGTGKVAGKSYSRSAHSYACHRGSHKSPLIFVHPEIYDIRISTKEENRIWIY